MKFIYFLFSPAVYTYVFFNYFVIIGIGSMFIGTLGALYQTNVKRFLGYTSINQFGFLLLAYIETWSSNSSIFFIVIYSFLYSLSIFPFFYIMSVFGDRKSKLGSVTNFSDFNYFYSYSFKYVIVLSFVFISGLPPFLLFFYKYYLLLNIFHTSNYLVVLYIILLSVLNLVYYLKIIKSVLFEGGAGNKKVLLITSSNKFSENYIDINRISTFLESFYLGFLIINFLLFFSFDFLYSDACARIIECLSPRGYFYIQI
jgi:NADH:ubiquinone oxidoreductase subunit 2 (subunit N)